MKGKKIALTVLLTLVFCLAATGAALAMSSSNYNLPWDVLSGGGIENRSSASYVLGDTTGQPSAIGLSASANYRLGSGFWYGASEMLPEPLVGDVNGDGRVNVLDMIRIGMHWGETGSPGWIPEDVNQDGVINVLDMILVGMNWTG